MSFGKETSKLDLVVDIKAQYLKVVYKNETRLEGDLLHSVSVENSLWTLSDGKLEITLSKIDKTLTWDSVIPKDTRGEKVLSPEEATEWHHRLVHMTSEEMVMFCTVYLNVQAYFERLFCSNLEQWVVGYRY